MQRFLRMRSLQIVASIHAQVFNRFNLDRGLSSRTNFNKYRSVAPAKWRQIGAA